MGFEVYEILGKQVTASQKWELLDPEDEDATLVRRSQIAVSVRVASHGDYTGYALAQYMVGVAVQMVGGLSSLTEEYTWNVSEVNKAFDTAGLPVFIIEGTVCANMIEYPGNPI
ncbi:MAG: hypothetical protein FWE67_14530 [Planctomycetaceae bacterium]|nr:hypothetical protein [Planctomycetaceae bacterium]